MNNNTKLIFRCIAVVFTIFACLALSTDVFSQDNTFVENESSFELSSIYMGEFNYDYDKCVVSDKVTYVTRKGFPGIEAFIAFRIVNIVCMFVCIIMFLNDIYCVTYSKKNRYKNSIDLKRRLEIIITFIYTIFMFLILKPLGESIVQFQLMNHEITTFILGTFYILIVIYFVVFMMFYLSSDPTGIYCYSYNQKKLVKDDKTLILRDAYTHCFLLRVLTILFVNQMKMLIVTLQSLLKQSKVLKENIKR
jgi:hypothetical protein